MARREICNTIDCKERLLLVVIEKDKYGGYKQDLLENDLDEMGTDFCVCSKCNGVMRNACLVNEPDQILVCEVCKIGEDSTPMVKARKNIPKLRVKCPLLNRGCVWEGILGEIDVHLDECTEFILNCSNVCGVKLKRSKLQNHCENECQLRIVKCKYCEATIQYKVLENHNTLCPEFPLLCPNECLKSIIRKELKSHIEKECPNTLITCPYKEMGCEVLSKRSQLQKHEKSFESKHLDKTKIFYLNKMETMGSIIQDLKNEIGQLTAKVRNLEKECRRSKSSKLPVLALTTPSIEVDELIERTKYNSGQSEITPAGISRKDQNNLSNEAYKMRTRKAALDIQYQLFTNLTPEKKRVGPFNTDQIVYCDLVNMICNQERNELGEDMTVELYTCEGYPLATRPISYISKLSDWCLEEYLDTPLLYAVPRLKCYTDKCTQYMTAAPLWKGKDSIFIRNSECGFYKQIINNCKQMTYFQLIKRIQDMTGIPGHLIQLYQAGNFIHSSTDVTLDKLNIVNQSALEIKPSIDFWALEKDRNFRLQECKPTWHQEQSTYGSTFFFSCLYSLADWMAEPLQKSSETLSRTLGHIRSITGCPPLIHALNLIFSQETLTLPHRVAIQECLVLLFKMMKPQTTNLPNTEVIYSEKVTEYSNYFWVYLFDYSTPGHTQSEHYSTFKLTCSETYQRMTDPVIVKDVNGVEHILEQTKVSTEIIVKYLYSYKRMIKCFIGDEAVVWNGISVPTCGVDLTGEWKSLVEKCKNYPALCVQAPLNVKSTQCRRPCMIPTENGNIGVYIDISKDANRPHVYYEVTTGQSILFDAQELDRDVKLKQPPCFKRLAFLTNSSGQGLQAITRDPEEIIMVILDTSGSMNAPYLDGKTKNQSVLEAFSAFCDRSTAYDLKHVIGLTLFVKSCNLQYPLSEHFREFNNQFRNFPPGTHAAIYVAINFAVQQLNNFTTRHPEYREVPRRILCLTGGGDNHSNITSTEATSLLIENKIKMDCVLLCDGIVETHAIAKASGGYSFKPKDSQELLNIFEQETMLSMKTRQHCTAAFVPGEKINLRSQFYLPIDSEPTHLLPGKINIKVQTPQKRLARALIQKQLSTYTNTDLTKRILQELSYYQAHPHPAIEVFPGEEHIDFWRIIMEGPEDTPYEGGIFELFIEFTNEYPAKPPNIRFITPIYHCNINSSGRICHTILDRFYSPGVRVGEIFNHVYGLLIDAEPDDPLDSEKATLLRCDSDEYLKKAKFHTEKDAKARTKRQVRIGLLGSDQNVQVNYPAHLVCPLTLELFMDPVATLSGDTYEKEAILEHLNSGKNYDPFTFRELHEDDLRPNRAVKRAVAEFKQEIERAGQL